MTPPTGGGLTAELIRLHNHSTAVGRHPAWLCVQCVLATTPHRALLFRVAQVAFVGMRSKHFDVARRSDGSTDSAPAQQLMQQIVAFTDTQCPVVLCVPGSQAAIVTTAL